MLKTPKFLSFALCMFAAPALAQQQMAAPPDPITVEWQTVFSALGTLGGTMNSLHRAIADVVAENRRLSGEAGYWKTLCEKTPECVNRE